MEQSQQHNFSPAPSRDHHLRLLPLEDALGHDVARPVGHLCAFALLVLAVLAFTIAAATYRPDDPLLHAASHLTSFLTSTASGSTFLSDHDSSVLPTGDDLLSPSNSSSVGDGDSPDEVAVNELLLLNESAPPHHAGDCDPSGPIDCSEQEVFHLLMRTAIGTFRDVHFYRFGKPARGGDGGSCDIAWRFRPKEARRAGFYKDYRRFRIARSPSTCAYSVVSIGGYHTGVNARKMKPGGAREAAKKNKSTDVPVVGEAVNDSLPKVESEAEFRAGKYLVYSGGGDRCKSMNHYLWSFLCALGEAQYLNRTLVMDLSICLSSRHTSTNQDEEGKDFRYYFDFEHLRDSARILDHRQFWTNWARWQKKDGLGLGMRLVEDFRTTPMKLAKVRDTLIVRKFGNVEPDNYWYRVCEGETESVIQRPWHMIWKSRRLMDIVSAIASRMSWDFDSVHVVAGEKAEEDAKQWPNLAADGALMSTLGERIDEGRRLYVATDEPDTALFDPLKGRYKTHFLDEFKDLWGEESEWYAETKKLNSGLPVEFDGYMRLLVDTEVFLRGKKQLRTFNDLKRDCKDGVSSCQSSS